MLAVMVQVCSGALFWIWCGWGMQWQRSGSVCGLGSCMGSAAWARRASIGRKAAQVSLSFKPSVTGLIHFPRRLTRGKLYKVRERERFRRRRSKSSCFALPLCLAICISYILKANIVCLRRAQMATKAGVEKAGVEAEAPQVHRIRITLTSKNVKNLEKGKRSAKAAADSQLMSCSLVTPA